MAQSLSKVYVHIIFSTKNRANLIDKDIKQSLFDYIGGIARGMECYPVEVGGHENHVHVLCQLSKKVAQVKLLEEIKKQSSKWIKSKNKPYSNFYWQDGYGVFSVNPSELAKVVEYINNQDEHHKAKSFQDEFRLFLKKYKVEYNERYIWD